MNRFLRLSDGTVWPEPWPVDPEEGGLEWRLRYCRDVTHTDRLAAASVCAAYAQLIALPRRRREQVIAAIRTQRPVTR